MNKKTKRIIAKTKYEDAVKIETKIRFEYLGAVKNVDIYELMCHILGLNPAPNDGSLDPFSSILAN